MGCFGSKEDDRRKAFGADWTGCEFAFSVGSVKSADCFCPLDKLVYSFVGEGKELASQIGELSDAKLAAEKAKELGEKIFTALKGLHAALEKDYKDGTKENEVMGKYTGTEAIKQVNDALTVFVEKTKIGTWPEVAADTAEKMDGEPAMMEEAPAMMDAEAAEGGDGEMAAGDAVEEGKMEAMMAAMAAVSIGLSEFGEIASAEELPKFLMGLMFSYPVVGDAVKAQVMHWELGGDSKDHATFAEFSAVASAYVDAGEKAEAESFGAAWLSGDDLDVLKEVAEQKDVKALIFPGVVGAWADQGSALGQAPEVKDKTQVLFKFKGKVLKPAGDKLHVFNRQFAKIESLAEPTDDTKYWVATLSDFSEHVYTSIEAWKKAVETVAAVVSDAKEAVEEAKENKEGEGDMMMAEAPAMDAPAAME